jgi:hypothetical protein
MSLIGAHETVKKLKKVIFMVLWSIEVLAVCLASVFMSFFLFFVL